MRSSRRLHALALATLVVVTLAIGWLQYRWIDEASDAEEARERARLREQVSLIVDALDTEITRAALVFMMAPVRNGAMGDALDETWALWNRDAPWPRIVSGVRLAQQDDDGTWRTRAWGDAGPFDPATIPRTEVEQLPLRPGDSRGAAFHSAARTVTSVFDGMPSVLSPRPSFEVRLRTLRIDWVLIRFNLSYLRESVLPQLLEQYATDNDRSEFRFELGLRGATASETVLVAEQFRVRPDCLLSGMPAQPALSLERLPDEEQGARSTTRAPSGHGMVGFAASAPVSLDAAGRCSAPPPTTEAGVTQISVRRAHGGSSDAFAGFRRRNLLLSGVMLGVLMSALVALGVSTARGQRLAQYQMVVAAGISHELRTPLASLNVAVDHLKNGHVTNPEQAHKYGELIEAQSRRLGHVVDQALALTRSSHASGTSRQTVSIADVVRSTADGFASVLKEAAIAIECEVASDVPLVVADPDLTRSCVTNLVENAIKYASSGGLIRVTVARSVARQGVEVCVEDRGPGIDADEVAAVFEPFYRGSSGRRSRQHGSGLGLAIVKGAVEAHGGSISLEQTVPHGSRFRLFFPAATTRSDGIAADSAG
jgi:signal transduction histidine kinase